MSERSTPETDALASEHRGAVIWPNFARRLEIQRDEARSDLEFRRGLFQLQEQQPNEVRAERDALQEQLDAAIMLGKLQERRHERDLEELIAAAKAVIDRWETPFWKEAAHTGACIAALRKAVEIAEGGHL